MQYVWVVYSTVLRTSFRKTALVLFRQSGKLAGCTPTVRFANLWWGAIHVVGIVHQRIARSTRRVGFGICLVVLAELPILELDT